MKRGLATILLFMTAAEPAAAHSPVKGIGIFYNGMLHPYLVPGHLLVLLALGLMIGQHAPSSSRYALPTFLVTFLASSALLWWLPIAPLPETLLLVVSLLAGLMVAVSVAPGLVSIFLAVVAGIVLGLNSNPEGVPPEQTGLALAGTVSGAVLAILYAGGLSAWLARFPSWPPIAVRVLGSWTAACALLVLVLQYAKTGAVL
ncbi:HupE/UreJ family protein [Rhizobium aouanii]|uniref:HupE/UreJ family protein n=1 Tax=Rhizobium aouanii TaxID=3118145 RepID=A0ABU8CVH4_9HYPH